MEQHTQIQAFSALLSVVAFFLLLRCEVSVQRELAMEGLIFLLSGAMVSLWSCALTLLSGAWRYPASFRLWQPFCGGRMFVLLQAIGWTLCGSGTTLALVVCANIATAVPGTTTTLAMVNLFGHITLSLSLSAFDPKPQSRNDDNNDDALAPLPQANAAPHPTTWPGLRPLLLSSQLAQLVLGNDWLGLAALLTTSSCVLLVLGDALVVGSILRSTKCILAGLSCLGFITSGTAIHFFAKCRLPGYRLFQPFAGGEVFVLMQAFGWTLFGVCLNVGLSVLWSRNIATGVLCVMACMGLLSQLLLVLSLPHFDPAASPSPAKPHTSLTLSPVAFSSASLLVCVAAFYTGLWMMLGSSPSLHSDMFVIVGSVGIHHAAPMAHYGGKLVHRNFSVWQPLQGGFAFVCAQAFGWTIYGVSIVVHLVCLVNLEDLRERVLETILALAPLTMLGQGTVIASLKYFHEPQHADDHPPAEGQAPPGMFGKDLFVSHLLSLLVLVVEVGLDVHSRTSFLNTLLPLSSNSVKAWRLAAFGGLLVAATITHSVGSTRHKGFSLWQPFLGGAQFIVWQAAAWTMFSIGLLVHALLFPTVPSDMGVLPVMSLASLFSFLAHALLCFSLDLFVPERSCQETRLGVTLRAVAVAANGTSARSELATALHALQDMRSRLHFDEGPEVEGKGEAGAALLLDALEREVVGAMKTHDKHGSALPKRSLLLSTAMNICLGCIGACVFLAAEYSRSVALASRVPALKSCESLLLCAVLTTASGCVFSHVVAARQLRGYSLFQPGVGGLRFVVLQGVGWTLLGIGLATTAALLRFKLHRSNFQAPIASLGLVFMAAFALLASSAHYFVAPPPAVSKTGEMSRSLVFSLITLAALAASHRAIVLFGPDFPIFPFLLVSLVSTLVSVPLTWWVGLKSKDAGKGEEKGEAAGKEGKKGDGSASIVALVSQQHPVLQLVGLTLWLFAVLITLLLLMHECCFNFATAFFHRGFMGSAGFSGVVAQVLVMISFSPRYNRKLDQSTCPRLPELFRHKAVVFGSEVLRWARYTACLHGARLRARFATPYERFGVTLVGDCGVGKSLLVAQMVEQATGEMLGEEIAVRTHTTRGLACAEWKGILVHDNPGTPALCALNFGPLVRSPVAAHVYLLSYRPGVVGSLQSAFGFWLPRLLARLHFVGEGDGGGGGGGGGDGGGGGREGRRGAWAARNGPTHELGLRHCTIRNSVFVAVEIALSHDELSQRSEEEVRRAGEAAILSHRPLELPTNSALSEGEARALALELAPTVRARSVVLTDHDAVEEFGQWLLAEMAQRSAAIAVEDACARHGWLKGSVEQALGRAVPREVVDVIGGNLRGDWARLPSEPVPVPARRWRQVVRGW